MRTCHQNTDSYTLDNSPSTKESEEKYRVTYVPSLPEIIEDTHPPKDMEAAWEDMESEPYSTEAPSHKAPTSEEIMSKNREICSAIESSKRNLKMFKTET